MHRKKIYIIVIVAFSVLSTTLSLYVYQIFRSPNILVNQPNKKLIIPYHTRFKNLQTKLYQEGFVKDMITFSFLARLMKYDRKIIPGCYELTANMSNREAITLLRAGVQKPMHITFHNIQNKTELAEKITRNVQVDAHDFEKLLNDTAFVQKYGFNLDNVLAMFIPNTYEVYWTITHTELFDKMYKAYQQFWHPARLQKAKALGLTPLQVAILASIVQGETIKPEEVPIMAGVYINRLKNRTPLQSCATLVYAVHDDSMRRVLHKHKNIDSPYNTYTHRGLPPGPINVPPIATIDGVLKAEKHQYLYFFSI